MSARMAIFLAILGSGSAAASFRKADEKGISASGVLTMLDSSKDFFRTASASISHDKNVLRRLEKHPLAHASGWNIQETQLPGQGWTESSQAAGPRLGGKAWEKKNSKLEKELERMSNSVNVMFKDQNDKRAYRRDEDKLFNQAVNALKTADELYPDTPGGSSSNDLAKLGLASSSSSSSSNLDSGFAHDEGRQGPRRSRSSPSSSTGPPGGRGLTRQQKRQKARIEAWYYGPSMTEAGLLLLGCSMLAAAAWIGFMFFRRKSYYDLRVDRDRPEGIEVA